MVVATAFLKSIIQTELIRKNKSELWNDNQLTKYDDQYAFIKKAMRLDDDVKEIVTRVFFNGFEFDHSDLDYWFKRAFVNRFYNRQIDFQTVETFASHVLQQTLLIEKELTFLYENFEKMATNESKELSEAGNERIQEQRQANAILPQNELNLNFDNMEMKTADDNTIGKSKETGNDNRETTRSNFSPSAFKELQGLLEGYLIRYDKYFFKF